MKKAIITISALVSALFAITALNAQSASTFINEINYLASNPVERGLEIAGQAGTDLTGYSLAGYTDQGTLAFIEQIQDAVIPNRQNGYGTIWYDVDQAGDTGGFALVNPNGEVEQFISYGPNVLGSGIIQATEGPASGMSSQHAGMQINPNHSLQLIGTGITALDFLWSIPLGSTPEDVNTLQTFLGSLSAVAQVQSTVLMGENNETAIETGNVEVNEGQIQLYPNPTVDMIRLQGLSAATIKGIQVINSNGQHVEVPVYRLDNYEVDAQFLPNGNYWLRVETNQGTIMKAFVKQ